MNEKKKWDLPTRILHWSIAVSIIGLLLTSLLAEAAEELYGKPAEIAVFYIHLYLGFFAIGAVGLRVVWGFFGNEAVNWRGVIAGIASYPAAAKAELEFLISGKQVEGRSRAAHNPLAVPVYLGAFFLFILTAATGLSLWDHLDQKAARHWVSSPAAVAPALAQPGQMAFLADDDDGDGHTDGGRGGHGEGKSEFVEEVHEFALFWVSLYLALHLGGIFMHYVREDRSVLRGMINP
ncbi:MAG: cytochrome b/b6 domain-containing protein [Nitrospinota bacterium]|nr:cytochrome b/b6 domain-containing protein [Nitrospinota bacterium]